MKRAKSSSAKGASSVSSGVRLEGVTKARCKAARHAAALTPQRRPQVFEGVELLKEVTWEVKKGERVGLVGWNGAGKTTQLRLITGELEADGGEIIRAKSNMQIAFLSQEFDVQPSRTPEETEEAPLALLPFPRFCTGCGASGAVSEVEEAPGRVG